MFSNFKNGGYHDINLKHVLKFNCFGVLANKSHQPKIKLFLNKFGFFIFILYYDACIVLTKNLKLLTTILPFRPLFIGMISSNIPPPTIFRKFYLILKILF